MTDTIKALQARVRELEANQARLEQEHRSLQATQERRLIEEKMAALGRLTAGMAHEINTPLAAARTSLAELERLVAEHRARSGDARGTAAGQADVATQMERTLRLADSALERIAGFVRDLKAQTLDLASQERVCFNAVPVIQEVLLRLSHTLNQAGCMATFYHAEDDVTVYGVPTQLDRVVANLITNAIDATAEQGGSVVALRLTPGAGGVELVVSDRGSGMPPEIVPKIFDPMFTTKRFGESLGLGLTIVHYIVTGGFGGAISVSSQPGQGTTFTIRFPNPPES